MRFQFPSIYEARDHILTALILVLSLGLLIARNQEGIQKLRRISITVFSYMEEPLADIRNFRNALSTNNYLRRQNVMLLDKLSRLRSAEAHNEKLRKLLNFKRHASLNLEPAQIVGKELTGLHNTLTIDAGRTHGVKANMPVINHQGLIGKVIVTSSRYSQVIPLYNTLFRVSARIENSNAYGIVSWDGEKMNRLSLNYVPQTVNVDTGKVVETSGYSNQFPPDIPIGTITGTESIKGKDIQRIFIDPFVSLHKVGYGFVVKYTPDSSLVNVQEKYREKFQ